VYLSTQSKKMPKARIPIIAQTIYKGALCRIEGKEKAVYLTFDDGPIPEATPLVLDILKQYNAKATFFCVGDNVRKHPAIYQRIMNEGHSVGNHTYNHVDGWKTLLKEYLENVEKCATLVDSKLFRPPYGRIGLKQFNSLKKKYKIVLWDLLSMDYDPVLGAEDCFKIVEKNTRKGSIIVFHDSIKAKEKIPRLLPKTLEFLTTEGYNLKAISATT
jgi:peptidoglycan/xylan/chitin deacetylase (PgdA/CDA1 family)